MPFCVRPFWRSFQQLPSSHPSLRPSSIPPPKRNKKERVCVREKDPNEARRRRLSRNHEACRTKKLRRQDTSRRSSIISTRMKHSNTFIVQLLLLCLCTTNGGAFLQGQQLTTSAVPRQPRRGRIPFPIYPGVEDVAFSRPGGKHVIETNNASLFGRRNTAASDGDDDHQHSLGLRSVIKSRIRAWWNVLVWFRGSTAWRKRFSVLKRRVMLLVISLALILNSTTVPAWAAVSGGRAGGTFKSSSSHRPSVSRHYSQPRHYHRPMYYQPRIHKPIYVSPPLGASYAQRPMAGGVSTMTKSDVLVLGSAAGLITYGVIQKRRNNNNDGSTNFNGATSTAVRFALNVPDRYDPNSIVHRLNEIAKRTDTSTQNGVQTLISEGKFV